MRKGILIGLCFLFLFGVVEGKEGYSVSQEVHTTKERGYHYIELDESVLSYAKEDLSDLRLINKEGVELPYYIVNAYKTSLREVPYKIEEKSRQTDLIIKSTKPWEFEKVYLYPEEIRGKILFNRHVSVYLKLENEEEEKRIGDGTLANIDLENTKRQIIEIPLYRVQTFNKNVEYIRVSIENEDNPALHFQKSGVNIVQNLHKLVFEANPNESYTLCYGNEKAKKPIYDLESFMFEVEKEEQLKATLGEIHIEDMAKVEEDKSKGVNQSLVNGIIGVVGLILVMILIKEGKNKLSL